MLDKTADAFIENRTFDEMAIGETASLVAHRNAARHRSFRDCHGRRKSRACRSRLCRNGHVSPHHHPGHVGGGPDLRRARHQAAGSGDDLSRPESAFHASQCRIGDTITATLTVQEKKPEKGDVTLDCVCTNQKGEAVITGTAYTRAPTAEGPPSAGHAAPRAGRAVTTQCARSLLGPPEAPAVATAVVNPVDAASLLAALDAAKAGLIVPVLIGPAARIAAVAKAAGADISALRLIDAPDGRAAAAQAVALARAGEVALLMKGDLHTDETDARGRCI